jgi:serine/threonine-protein kinase
VAVEMVNTLDQWAFIRRAMNRQDPSKARHLSAVAKAADPDPWRCRLRDALDLEVTDRKQAHAAFDDLAALAPEDVRYRESISRLAFALRHLGDNEAAISLLRRVQRAHPDDFWINFDLAGTLMHAGRPDEAVRFFSAALAIGPRSELALGALGEALRAAGKTEEAETYPRHRWGSSASGRQGPGGPRVDRDE